MMNPTLPLRRLLALACALAAPAAVQAATYLKADNTNSLDQAVSWGGTAPGSGDIASWAGTYSAGGATNSLSAVLPRTVQPSWAGISIGSISGSALANNIIGTLGTTGVAGTNITAITEANLNGFNVMTVTTIGSHGFEPGMAVTFAGVTPAAYNGTFIVAGVNSATQFTCTNATGGLAPGSAFGSVSGIMYLGGTATAVGMFTNGPAGITLASGGPSLVLNVTNVAFDGSQVWTVPAGKMVRFTSGGAASFANGRAVSSGNDGNIEISGGGLVSLNPGSGSALADPNSFAQFTGTWQVDSGCTLRSLRNGASAFTANANANAITLNGGILAVGGGQGDVGNWTWTVPVTLNAGTTSYLADENVAGTGRYLLLNNIFAGSGNLTFIEPLVGATTFTSPDLGFVVAGANTLTGTVTIGGPVENGVSNRFTYVRLGAPGTAVAGTGVGNGGSLGSGNIVNNGVLTFTYTTGVAVPNAISGTGTLRIGSLASTYVGAAYQNVQLQTENTYTGPTIINAGTLSLLAGSSIANSSSISIVTNSVNGGAAVNTFDVSGLTGAFTTAPGQTLSVNGGQLNGNFSFGPGSTNVLAPGGSNVVGTLAINGNLSLAGGANTFVLDINNSANDQVNVSGNLTATGVTTLQFVPPGTGLNAGTYPLITVGDTVTATPANFAIAGLASGTRPQTFSVSISGNTVNLVVVGSPGNLTWVGDGTANGWSTTTTVSNWFNTVNSVKDIFVSGDLVTFDDTGSATPAINLTGVVRPGAITLNNSSQNYTIRGTGQLAGTGVFTMNGPGNLTLLTSNSFGGTLVINGGTLAITNEAALGEPTNPTPASVTLSGGTLLITNTMLIGANTNRGLLLGSGNGTLIVTNGATLTISNAIGDTTGSSVLTKTGNGTLLLDGLNSFGGGLIVQNGTLVSGTGSGLGKGANTSGTSGFWEPPFELDNGVVDINGQSSYQPNFAGGSDANGTPVVLFNGTLNFVGQAGGSLTFQDSGVVPSGWGSTVATVLNYQAVNNPGTLTIAARFCSTGTSGNSTRTLTIEDSAATTTEVNIVAPMGVLSLNPTNQDSRNVTIIKNGAGTLQISAANNFPVVEVDAGTLRVNHPQALGTDRSISTGVSGGTGTPSLVTVTAGTVDLNGFSPAIGGLNDNATTTGLVLNNGTNLSTLTLGFSWSNTVYNASYSSVLADGTSPVWLNKVGTNTQVLAGVNTYSGGTTVSHGTLLVNAPGQIGLGAATNLVTVAGGSLGGSGLINAPVLVQAGGTLAPGAGATAPVALTVAGNLTLAGTTSMNVNKDVATNDVVALTAGSVTYGGTLVVTTNLMATTTLVLGDSFQLFSVPAHSGNFASVVGAPAPGLGWSFNPANGVVTVVPGVASNSTNITASVTGGTMTIAWPADHLGWWLQAQTNSLNTGLGTNWTDVAGSAAVTSVSLPVVPANPAVFFRLRHP